MGKRKQDSDVEEDAEHSASESDSEPKKVLKAKPTASKGKAASKPKTVKKPKIDEPEEGASPAREESKHSGVKLLKSAEGEKYMNLGKQKRVTVRGFKGQVYVDIREFYGTAGDEKPGKKGISLTTEQWEVLKGCMNTVDSLVAEQTGKK